MGAMSKSDRVDGYCTVQEVHEPAVDIDHIGGAGALDIEVTVECDSGGESGAAGVDVLCSAAYLSGDGGTTGRYELVPSDGD